jgi:hypothetical protein
LKPIALEAELGMQLEFEAKSAAAAETVVLTPTALTALTAAAAAAQDKCLNDMRTMYRLKFDSVLLEDVTIQIHAKTRKGAVIVLDVKLIDSIQHIRQLASQSAGIQSH